eukprot:5944793-Pyramimonas_sp.AAC.3
MAELRYRGGCVRKAIPFVCQFMPNSPKHGSKVKSTPTDGARAIQPKRTRQLYMPHWVTSKRCKAIAKPI